MRAHPRVSEATEGIVWPAGFSGTLKFSPEAFFYGLLPPIVFAAGRPRAKALALPSTDTGLVLWGGYAAGITGTCTFTGSAHTELSAALQVSP